MLAYLDLLRDVFHNGEDREDRTGVGTRSLFGKRFTHKMSNGFPLLTTKKLHWKSIVHELLWLISGKTNVKYLNDNGVTIWNEWADKDGDLGPVYGKQWRKWNGCKVVDLFTEQGMHVSHDIEPRLIDQLSDAIQTIRNNPYSRRNIVTAWNPTDLPDMRLPPCHMMYQFYWHTDNRLSIHMYQRSADIFLGVPFNIASYALLLKIVCAITDTNPGDLHISFGDLHIYKNHFSQVAEQLSREPYALPGVNINYFGTEIDHVIAEHIQLLNYKSHGSIKAPIAV